MRCLVIFFCGLMLTACSNLSLDGIASAGTAAATGAGVTALTGSPIAGAAVGAAAGVGADAVIPDFQDAAQDFCTANPEDCDRYLLIQAFEKIWKWALGGLIALVTIAWIIPGPQTLLFWRKSDARSNSANRQPRSDWPNP